MPGTSVHKQSSKPGLSGEEASDRPRLESVSRQWLGTTGANSVTKWTLRRAFFYSIAFAAVAVAVVNALDVITWMHEKPGSALVVPIVAEGTSGISFMLFFWIPWCAWLWAPPFVRPRWKLLIHIPAALVFALAHISGFILLRWLAAWAPGIPNLNSPLAAQFLYDAPKDALSYILFGACFALVGRLLRRSTLVAGEPAGKATYDIRDGAKLTRVRLDQILVIASAGNYVEFTLADGRTLLMRSPLAAVEREFAPRGFVRTHRSRLVNAARVTALKPEGSGDYIVELGSFTAPLSRRFPEALARLRNG